MTKYASKDVSFFYLGPYSILGATTKIEDVVTLRLTEALALGDTDEGWFSSGVRHNEVTQEGWFDDSTNSLHDALVGLPSTLLPMALAPHGQTWNSPVILWSQINRVGYDVQLTASEVTKANGVYSSFGSHDYGNIVAPPATYSGATGNTDTNYIDMGAAWTGDIRFYGFVTALTLGGYTDLSTRLRHSTDHITFTNRTTLAAISAPDGKFIDATTSTTNQYVSMGWTFNGTGTSPSLVGVFCFAKIPGTES